MHSHNTLLTKVVVYGSCGLCSMREINLRLKSQGGHACPRAETWTDTWTEAIL